MFLFRLLFVLFLFFPLTVQAVGVSVSPSTIDLFSPNFTDKEIIVKNISAEPIVIYVYPDDFSENISVNPNEVELLPAQVSAISIRADFKDFDQGVRHTNISVLSKAKDKKSFNAISGVKIPTSIYINKSNFTWSGPAVFVAVFFGLLIILLLAKIFFKLFTFNTKSQTKKWLSTDFLFHHKKKKWYKWW